MNVIGFLLKMFTNFINFILHPFFILTIKIIFIFLLLIIVRITVPRIKLELLNKLGWLLVFSILFFSTCLMWVGFLAF